MLKNKKYDQEFNNILDTFGGADGGVSFVRLQSFLKDIENRWLDGDKDSGLILDIMSRFSKLIDIANER